MSEKLPEEYKKYKKFIREATIEELKKALVLVVNRVKTKRELTLVCKEFADVMERRGYGI